MHRDIRPGDVTHEHMLEKYQTYYYSTRKILSDLKYATKEERCVFLTSILKVYACSSVSRYDHFLFIRWLISIAMPMFRRQ